MKSDHAALFRADSAEAAQALQTTLAERVIEAPFGGPPRLVAGVDVAFDSNDPRRAAAAVAVWSPATELLVETACVSGDAGLDYASGMLAFRETPLALEAAAKLKAAPDLYLYDANGRWHPRRFGAACHFGLALDRPTIGVAKTPAGEHDEPGAHLGARTRIENLAWALRSRAEAKPIFVSVGHRVTFDEIVALTLGCCRRFRVPEPVRLADQAARRALAEGKR